MDADKKNKSEKLTAEELKELVLAAQNNDEEALKKLCEQYAGMIKTICTRPVVRNVLGYEDAINYAYVYLLELILSYKEDKWDIFPGLLYTYTMRKMYKEINRQLMIKNNEVYAAPETGTDCLEAPAQVGVLPMAEVNLQIFLEQVLSPLELKIIKLCYGEEKSIQETADILGFSWNKVRYHRRKAFSTIAKYI